MREPLKLMTFNILTGGGEEVRFSRIKDLIRRVRPDILVLQECLDWEKGDRVKQIAQTLEIPYEEAHARLALARPRGSGKCYHIGVWSRFPLESFKSHNDPAFIGHALAEFQVRWGDEPLTIFGAHFDSKNENLRFVETRYLRSLLDPAAFRKGLYALAGDLNSLSSSDPYPPELESLLRESLTTKYNLPPRFEVTQELEEYGWVDGLYLNPPLRWVTATRDRGGLRIDYRNDYIMFSPALAKHAAQVEVLPLKDESDHSPVLSVLY